MFYDLNVPWTPNDPNLTRTIAFLHELGYNVVALNHTITGKLPADLTSPIPDPIFPSTTATPPLPPTLRLLRRVTLTLSDAAAHQNARLAALAREYDVLALRPTDEKTLALACGSLECDIISLDLTLRFPFYFKHKMLSEAVRAGKRFEICYAQGVAAGDGGGAAARRNLISNATQLIRATRGRGLLLCSEAKGGPAGCRGPWDVINLAAIWGLGQERGYEAMTKEARNAVVSAELKRTGYKGVVDVVYGGDKPVKVKGSAEKQAGKQKQPQASKRKADALDGVASTEGSEERPISNREAKRRARKARFTQGELIAEPTAAGDHAPAVATEQINSG